MWATGCFVAWCAQRAASCSPSPGIGLFLGIKAIPVFRTLGWSFFTTTKWNPETGHIGIAAVLVGTFELAAVAIIVAFPLALGLALYISEYAPPGIKRALISLVDLMAAIPSVVYGLFGFFFLMPRALYVSHWLAQNLSCIPVFEVKTNANAPNWQQSDYTSSLAIAGLVVAFMVLPMACSVMREVFSLSRRVRRRPRWRSAPPSWGMIRTVAAAVRQGRHHRRHDARARAGRSGRRSPR